MSRYTVEVAKKERDCEFIIYAQQMMAMESEGIQLDSKTIQDGVTHVFEHSEIGSYYVALNEQGKPVGCLLTLYEWSDWRAGNIVWIHSVYTLPEFRKTGVYKSLYQFLVDKVEKDDSLRGLRLYVEKENEKAIKAYESLGMKSHRYHLYEWLQVH
ncbi:MAG: GNAT family N-acetyltransferase [Halobacteriovoraceae bacterium]|nr:GNAT family N-acetyltransferase [Halobacteriovoraceae bacterium]